MNIRSPRLHSAGGDEKSNDKSRGREGSIGI